MNASGGTIETRGHAADVVVRVDECDRAIGVCGKTEAHQPPGLLHRAFSLVILNPSGDLLIQRRAEGKPTFAGQWSNSCCSHPRPGEGVVDAAVRRAREELALTIDPSAVGQVSSFLYCARDHATGLVEHEYDHVLVTRSDGAPRPDPAEIGDWRWTGAAELRRDMQMHPMRFTPWFAPVLDALAAHG